VNPPTYSGRGTYEIVIKGHLDEELSYWLEGLTVACGFGEEGTPLTTLTVQIADQAALHGVLANIRDLNLPLISVCPAGDVTQVEPESDQPGSEDEPPARSEGGADAS
jgi:hypothetical protein